jgi:hypothetical protein
MMDELHPRAVGFDTLVGSLQSSDSTAVRGLLRSIRNGASTDEIIELAKAIIAQDELRAQSRVREAVLSIASLTVDPPLHVPAAPWTNVIPDDETVSHLISVYFTWQHCGYPSVDQTLFVQAMQAKDLTSPFCSPFLVNSMLAVACVRLSPSA